MRSGFQSGCMTSVSSLAYKSSLWVICTKTHQSLWGYHFFLLLSFYFCFFIQNSWLNENTKKRLNNVYDKKTTIHDGYIRQWIRGFVYPIICSSIQYRSYLTKTCGLLTLKPHLSLTCRQRLRSSSAIIRPSLVLDRPW